ncbi:hypothetical protein [Naasia aerilata]|uniref:hypothetical protein n=1 Tax=Naasia aerilata TaxID=1162966 RepID=UPI002572E180|nr:hypothetical protein [Naasia aerilata]
MSEALGAPFSAVDPAQVVLPQILAVEQLGGIHCSWAQVDDPSVRSWFTVLPASAGSEQELNQVSCYGPCAFGTASNGLWLAGVVYPSAAEDESSSAVAALTSAFASSAARQPAPVPPGAVPGRWAGAVDCAALSDAAGLPAALGDPQLHVDRGDYPGEAGPGAYAAAKAAGVTNCWWSSDEPATRGPLDFAVQLLPAGGWVRARIEALPGAQSISVPGADAAFVVATSSEWRDSEVLHVFAGGNWMTVQSSSTAVSLEDVLPAVPPLLSALARG